MKNCIYVIEELIVKSLFHPLSAAEVTRLENWQDESPEHKKLYNKIKDDDRLAFSYRLYRNIDWDKAWKRFKQEIGYCPVWKPWYRIAALFLIPLTIGGVIFFWNDQPSHDQSFKAILPGCSQAILTVGDGEKILLGRDSLFKMHSGQKVPDFSPEKGEISYRQTKEAVAEQEVVLPDNTLYTPRGSEYKITLADGTRVHLNYNTSLRYPVNFGKSARIVYLKGEAYFEVASDPDRPFYVITENMMIKQYGTSFNINTYSPENTFVVLVKGSIGVRSDIPEQEILIKPGQKASLSAVGEQIDITDVDIEKYIAWNQGYFLFEEETLENIMQILSNWYNVKVVFDSPELKYLHFTGNLDRYKVIGPALRAICRSANIRIKIEDDTIYISYPYANLKQ